jgi:hypothetical protein
MHLSVIGLVGLIHAIILCRVKYLLLSHPTPQACFPPNSCVQFFPLDNPGLMIVSQVLVEICSPLTVQSLSFRVRW